MISTILVTILGILYWVGGGYLAGKFIIRWNKRHLMTKINVKKFAVADRLNADVVNMIRNNERATLIAEIVFAPITIPKAILLRLCGGAA